VDRSVGSAIERWEDMDDWGLNDHQSEIFKRQVWATYQTDLVGLHLIQFFGEGHIMWGSDYPHPDSTWPFSKEIIEKDTGHLPSEMKKKVIHDNAAALYGLS
jgi:uncharacterized protein